LPASVDTVAADTGPLIALARVDCVRLLPAPFARVLTAPAVLAEVAAGTGCPEGVQIEAAVNAGAIAVEPPPSGSPSWGLGPGETDLLRLALKRGCGSLLDDRAARRIATALGIPVGSVACIMLEPGTRVSHRAAALAAGYAPAVGFIHSGKPLSFVYDVADIVKFDTVVPVAFKIAAKDPRQPEREVRLACRDVFRSSHLLGQIIPMIEEVLAAGGLEPPKPPKESVPPAIPQDEGLGDVGHRH